LYFDAVGDGEAVLQKVLLHQFQEVYFYVTLSELE